MSKNDVLVDIPDPVKQEAFEWLQRMRGQSESEVSGFHGTSVLQELLNTTLVLHWKCVGIFSSLLVTIPQSRHEEVMASLAAISASFASAEQELVACITIVENAACSGKLTLAEVMLPQLSTFISGDRL